MLPFAEPLPDDAQSKGVGYCNAPGCPRFHSRHFCFSPDSPVSAYFCDSCGYQGILKRYEHWTSGPPDSPISGVWVHFDWNPADSRYLKTARVETQGIPAGRVYHLSNPFVSVDAGALRQGESLLANLTSGYMRPWEGPKAAPSVIDWDADLESVVKATQAAIAGAY